MVDIDNADVVSSCVLIHITCYRAFVVQDPRVASMIGSEMLQNETDMKTCRYCCSDIPETPVLQQAAY